MFGFNGFPHYAEQARHINRPANVFSGEIGSFCFAFVYWIQDVGQHGFREAFFRIHFQVFFAGHGPE